MELKEEKPRKRQLSVILSGCFGIVAIAAIVALIILLTRGTNIKTNYYSVTFVANTDDKHEGTIQSQGEKTFSNLTRLDAGFAPDALSNYTFDYWCSDSELTKPAEFPISLSKNEKFYAHWSKVQSLSYKVSFNTDGGSIVGETSVTKGESISRPEAYKLHYELKAWHENSIQGKEVFKKISDNEYEKYQPTENVVLFTEWVQSEFNVGLDVGDGAGFGGQDTLKDVNIGGKTYKGYEYTKSISSAAVPFKSGCSFQGWYKDVSFNEETLVTFPLEVKSDMVLHAKWKEETKLPTLTIDANGGYLPKVGGEVKDPTSRAIQTDLLPYSPTAYFSPTYKDQYNLLGWYDVNDKKVSFPLAVASDTTIKAKWEKVRFNATIYATEHEITNKRELNHWENLALCRYADIPIPETGDKDLSKYSEGSSAKNIKNYVLDKWEIYKIEGDTETHIEEQDAGKLDINPLKFDVNIYAKWKQTKFNITLHNGAATKLLESQTKDTIGTSGPAVPDGWVGSHEVFSGWYSDSECKNKIDFTTYELTSDDDFYTKSTLAQGKVYLHTTYAKDSTTYNGTEDYYYTEDFKELGAGFAARDLPDKEHYKKLGWTFTESDYEGAFPDPKGSDIIYSKTAIEESGKIKPWPSDGIRPKAGKIAHLYPTYEQSQFEIKFDVGEKATACNSIWTSDKDEMTKKAKIDESTPIPTSSKTFATFKGWSLTKGGSALTEEQLKQHEFSEDTILYAVWETNAWTVNFYVIDDDKTYADYSIGLTQEGLTQLSSGSLADVVNSLESSESIHKRTGAKLAGFVTENNKPISDEETYDLKNMISSLNVTRDTNLYAVYYKTDFIVKINPNGATIGGSSEQRVLLGSNEPVADKSVWYAQLQEQYGTIATPSGLPTFYGFAIAGTSTVIDFPCTLTESIELDMIWVNNSKYMVTFDTGNGDFYYNQNGVLRTTSLISYEVDINDTSIWTKNYKPTLKNVFEQARKKKGCIEEDYLVNDGFTFQAWKYDGIDIGDGYLITTSKGFEARWERSAASNWWDDSTGLIISYAEDMSSPSSGTYKSVLEEKYYDAYHGTKATKDGAIGTKTADTFVGLEKEVKIPTLSTTYKFTTRVIGEKVDIASDGATKTYLTIQFVDSLMEGCYASDSNKDPRYGSSLIRTNSIPYLLQALPGSLTSHFQSVKKPYLTGSATKSTDCKTMTCTDESLFILSAYELGGSIDDGGSAKYENDYKKKTGTGSYDYSNYMIQYAYYKGLGDGQSAEVPKRAFTYPYSNTTTYINAWTRTPRGALNPAGKDSGTGVDVYFIGHNNSNIHKGSFCTWDPMSGYGICPAFCIGLYTRS